MILSPDENLLQWQSRLSGYRVPVIAEITVEKKSLPVVSILLFSAALMLLIVSIPKKRQFQWRPVILGIAAIGLVLYPFVNFPVNLPWISKWAPSVERTATILDGLLTNVCHAFDVRDEDWVYDRLAMSVTGNQLSQIYLENRKALEFENRGGARANVDEVDILSVNRVKRAADEGFTADAAWTRAFRPLFPKIRQHLWLCLIRCTIIFPAASV